MSTQSTLTTDRLILRAFERADAADVQHLAGVRDVSDTLDSVPYPYKDGMAEQWISTLAPAWAKRKGAVFAVCAQSDRSLIGCVGLTINKANARASLGYWIGVNHWRRGYCTEASRAVLDFAFDRLGLNRVEAFHVVHNPASGAVMRKIGMSHEATHRSYFLKNGVFSDAERFAIIASDRRAG